ncbi:hypothetical protein EU546_04860 [Candidatus Thorarchaeota archaeon]|nr:MAG: hypothetical protein EU546_04860 [Candidatus Thorarchaeota archaeon]
MQFDFFDDFFGIFNTMFIFILIFAVVVMVVIGAVICKAGSTISREISRGFTLEAPQFVIPDRYRGQTRSDGSQMSTVRLPERCPSCGAALSHEGIDWVGPLEAKCNYCGGTVRATFERL